MKMLPSRAAHTRLQRVRRQAHLAVTPFILRKTARTMLPFYAKIAGDAAYAERWSVAVRAADLDDMLVMLRQVIPGFNDDFGLSVNGIGYFVDIPVPKPVELYTNGTGIPPGMVQFHFNTRAHRIIAQAIRPLYRTIADNRLFAEALAEALRRKNLPVLNRLIRSKVTSPQLRKVNFETYGFSLRFTFSFEKYPYENLFFYSLPL